MTTVLLDQKPIAPRVHTLEQTILDRLEEESVVGLDELIEMLPQYSWNQIFQAVDQLARFGKIVLRRHRYDYTLFSTSYAA
ncbi:MAG TPA: hypothetical protein VFM05_08070 [Candidatus Saccharimonadales bacterium]|nr:hypothetical protein [Candidatus Saccharimonadales bacterium]